MKQDADRCSPPSPGIDDLLRSFPPNRDLLIELLHAVQERCGHLDHDLLARIAGHFDLPPSLVYGVATFYHSFRLEPVATHHCTVCLGTTCHIRGGRKLLSLLEENLGVRAGTTDSVRGITLDSVRCLGTCGFAPLAAVDGAIVGGSSPEEVAARITETLMPGESPAEPEP